MDTVEKLKSLVTEAKDAVVEKAMEAKDAVAEKIADVRDRMMGGDDREAQQPGPNALDFLRQEHELINGLFDQLLALGDRAEARQSREGLFGQLLYELETHALIEEQLFYPALERADQDGGL